MGTKITLTKQEAHELFSAIAALDGRVELATDSDGKAAFVNTPYEFDDYKVAYGLAKTRGFLRGVVRDYEDAGKELRQRLSGKEKLTEKDLDALPADQRDKLDRAFRDLAREPVEVEVHKVKVEALKIHTNKIPPGVVCGLLPMLDGEL